MENSIKMIYPINRNCISKLLCLMSSIVFIYLLPTAYAATPSKIIIDVYGTDQITVADVKKKVGADINAFGQLITSLDKYTSKDGALKGGELFLHIHEKLENMGKFAFVNMSTVVYSNDNTVYFTIDAVDLKDKHRLSYFLPKPTKDYADPDNLIAEWMDYEKATSPLTSKTHQFPTNDDCPFFHCLYGFEGEHLVRYKNNFGRLTPKNKDQLVLILRNDKNESKRAAAAYLLAHIKDGHELVELLTPSINDSSPFVRNNVMRVLWKTLLKVKTDDFPIEKVVTALDFPNETDRNKAALILFSLSDQAKYALYIKQHAAKLLMKNLHQAQPNIHETVYDMLKKISGKNYSSRDYKAWEQWLGS